MVFDERILDTKRARAELIASLSKDDVEWLWAKVKATEKKEVLVQEACQFHIELSRYIAKTPLQRKLIRRYRWTPGLRVWVTYLAILLIELGDELLETFDDPRLYTRASPRKGAGTVARIAGLLFLCDVDFWPFDDRDPSWTKPASSS